MITEQLVVNYIQQRAGIPVLNNNGEETSIEVGDKVKEGFLDLRKNPRIFYERTLEYINGDSNFKDESGNFVETFCAFLLKGE